MNFIETALAGRYSAALLQTQGGRALPEIMLALTLFAAIATALAHRHIGGLLLRIAKWVSLAFLALLAASLFL